MGRKNRPGISPSPSCTMRQEPVAFVRPFRASLPAQASSTRFHLPNPLGPVAAKKTSSLPETSLRSHGDGFAGEFHPCSCVRPRGQPADTRSPNGHNDNTTGSFCQMASSETEETYKKEERIASLPLLVTLLFFPAAFGKTTGAVPDTPIRSSLGRYPADGCKAGKTNPWLSRSIQHVRHPPRRLPGLYGR